MRVTKKLLLGAVVTTAALVMTACAPSTSPTPPNTGGENDNGSEPPALAEITVGVITSETGPLAGYGKQYLDAITGINDYTFRSGRQSAQDVATAGTFLDDIDDIDGSKVVVFAQNNAFGKGNVAAVEAILGGQGAEVQPILVAEDVTEFTPFAQQVLSASPDRVFVVDELPRTTIEKVARRELRTLAERLLAQAPEEGRDVRHA